MKPISFFFSANGTSFEGTLTHKFSILCGMSATGKSVMRDVYRYSDEHYTKKIVFANIEDFIANILDGTYLDGKYTNTVLFIDEPCIDELISCRSKDKLRHAESELQKFPGYVVFINRDYSGVPISYESVYELVLSNGGKHHTLKRVYPSYDKLDGTCKEYVCEDSNTGYVYYSCHLDNVISAGSNANIYRVCNGKYVIADGAAIGPFVRSILRNDPAGVYFPISFEYDILCSIPNKSEGIRNPLSVWDPNTFLSMERLFTSVMQSYCAQKLHEKYDKATIPAQLIFNVFVQGLPAQLSIWGTICKRLNIVCTLRAWESWLNVHEVSTISDYVNRWLSSQPDKNIAQLRSVIPTSDALLSDDELLHKYAETYIDMFPDSIE